MHAESHYPQTPPNGTWALHVRFGLGEGVMGSATNLWRTQIGHTVLVFAGETRLDNRLELVKHLGLPATSSDAEIICHAYAADQTGFQRLLLGDFSFALFDEGQRVLRLVRDHLGVCPLYYHLDHDTCAASNSLDQLLDISGTPVTLEDKVVAEWSFGGHVFNQEDTFYKSIKKCPRAMVLSIAAQSVRSGSYWGEGDVVPLRYGTDGDYIERLQELLTTAIGDRMNGFQTSAAHSSGGLDSTPIAIIAGSASRKFGQTFHTFNWCKPDHLDSPSSPEWDNARRVAQAQGFVHHEIGASADALKESLFTHDIARDGTTSFEYEREVLRQAQHLGIRQIYSGFGGDEFLTAAFREQHYAEIRSGRFVNAYRRLALEANPVQDLRWLRLCVAYGRLLFKSLLPKRLQLRNFYQLEKLQFHAHRELLTDQFAEFAQSQRRNNAELMVHTIRQRQSSMLTAGYHQERIECWDTLARRVGVRYVYPYLDKRIVEFAMAIPPELFFKHGQPRHLYLQALGTNAPDFLSKKAKLSETFRVTQLMREQLKALADPEIHEMIAATDSPYVNTKALLVKCRASQHLDTNNLLACIVHAVAATTAIRTLNINKARESLSH